MVVCDQVHKDPATSKSTILGTFSTVFAETFPTQARFALYVALTELNGTCDLRIQIVNSDPTSNEEPLFQARSKGFEVPNPLAVIEIALPVVCAFPGPGVYHCELYVDDEPLISRRLIVASAEDLERSDGTLH